MALVNATASGTQVKVPMAGNPTPGALGAPTAGKPAATGPAPQTPAVALSSPAPVTGDPRDAQYYQQVAAINLSLQNGMANYGAGGQQDVLNQSARDLANKQLTAAQPAIMQNTLNQANRAGVLTSGITGQRESQNVTNYETGAGRIASTFATADQARIGALAGAQDTYGSAMNTALSDANARYLAYLQANPPALTPVGQIPIWQQVQQVTKGLEPSTWLGPNAASLYAQRSTAAAKLPIATQIAMVRAGIHPVSWLGPNAKKIYQAGGTRRTAANKAVKK
jgi:hypothetical protein